MKYYFFAQDGIEHGPFTLDELKEKRLKESTLVWTEGMSEWVVADSIEDLRHILLKEPPPLPKIVVNSPSPIKENLDVPEIFEIKGKKHTPPVNNYDISYTRDSEAIVVGAIALLVLIIVNIPGIVEFDAPETYSIFLIVLLIFRILATIWVVRIAARQNRNKTAWGWFAFFLPSIALIFIGSKRKLCKDDNNNNNVSHGKHTFLTKNLDVAMFQNGDLISEVQSPEEWIKAYDNKMPAWCYYNNDETTGKIFGKLYNWYAVNDPRGLAPKGYRIPSTEEWSQLESYEPSEIRRLNLNMHVEFDFYKKQNTDQQINLVPFGYRLGNNGSFPNQKGIIRTYFWSSSEVGNSSAVHYYTENTSLSILKSKSDKGNGYYVRCLKD